MFEVNEGGGRPTKGDQINAEAHGRGGRGSSHDNCSLEGQREEEAEEEGERQRRERGRRETERKQGSEKKPEGIKEETQRRVSHDPAGGGGKQILRNCRTGGKS